MNPSIESQQFQSMPRRYALTEIDQMRVLVTKIIANEEYGQGYFDEKRAQQAEMKLRTYLLSGISVDELAERLLTSEVEAADKRRRLRMP